MFELFYNLISNRSFLIVGAWLGEIITVMFIFMVVRKRNRDERGWKILGKASIAAFIWLIILGNVIAKIVGNINFTYALGFIQYANTIQWIYTSTILVEIVSIFIIRKIE